MKKSVQGSTIVKTGIDKNLTEKTIKTTNVNVLLNRVKLDKKKYLRKKIIFLSLLVFVICVISLFAII